MVLTSDDNVAITRLASRYRQASATFPQFRSSARRSRPWMLRTSQRPGTTRCCCRC